MFEQYDELLTLEELQDILKCGRNTAYKLIATGDVEGCFKCGRIWKIPKRSVEVYIKKAAGVLTSANTPWRA